MALPNRYPLPQVVRREVHRTEDGRTLVLPVRVIHWSQIIGAMKIREMERAIWKDELIVWLNE